MSKLLALLLIVVVAPAAADQHVLTEEMFTEEFARALAKQLPDGGFEVTAPLEILVGDEESGQGTISLHNLYRSASEDPVERALQIKTFVGAILSEPTDSFSAGDRARILPVVRDDAFVAQATLNRDDPTVNTPLVADLSVLYVLDFPDRVQFLLESNLADLELDEESVRDLAVDNLAAKSDEYRVQTMEGIYFLELDGMYETSALLLDEFWSAIETEIGAPPVVAVPTRDILVFAPSNDPIGVELVNRLAVQIEAESGYPISRTLLIRRNDRWETYR